MCKICTSCFFAQFSLKLRSRFFFFLSDKIKSSKNISAVEEENIFDDEETKGTKEEVVESKKKNAEKTAPSKKVDTTDEPKENQNTGTLGRDEYAKNARAYVSNLEVSDA